MSDTAGRKKIIIYEKATGLIKGVKMTGSITHKGDMSKACGGIPGRGLFWIGVPRETEIDINLDRVKKNMMGDGYRIYDQDGMDKAVKAIMIEARAAIEKSEGVFITSRPGIGDVILTGECAAEVMKIYPGKRVLVGGPKRFEELVKHLVPKIEWGGDWGDGSLFKGIHHVNQNKCLLWDPRGGTFGHVANRGVDLGVERMEGTVGIEWEPGERGEHNQWVGYENQKIETPVLGVHIKSNSSHTRSWTREGGGGIAERWVKETGGDVILFGCELDYGLGKNFRYVGQNDKVMKGAAAVSICSLMVAVDSGPMHLARIQGVKTIYLWGSSRPGLVLGREVCSDDIIGDGECGGNGCDSCNQKKTKCMDGLTIERVWDRVEEVKYGLG